MAVVGIAVVAMTAVQGAGAAHASTVASALPAGWGQPLEAVAWSQSGFSPKHRNWNPDETILTASNVGELAPAWTFDSAQTSELSGLAEANGIVYAGSNTISGFGGKLLALDATTGALIWKQKVGRVAGSPAVVNGVVYVAALGNKVYAFDAATGALLWKRVVDGSVTRAPTVKDGLVYVGTEPVNFIGPGTLYALHASTGKAAWSFAATDSAFIAASPTVGGGVVVVGTFYGGSGTLYALDSSTGRLLWSDSGAAVLNAATIDDGLVYLDLLNDVEALDLSSGAVVWSHPLFVGGWTAVAGNTVFVGTGAGDRENALYALNRHTGAVRWRAERNQYGVYDPSVAGGVVYVALRSDIAGLAADSGAPLFSYRLGIGPGTSIVVDGALYATAYHELTKFVLPAQTAAP